MAADCQTLPFPFVACPIVGGLAEAATGPAGPASYRLEAPRTVVDARTRNREARSGGCGFELAILDQGNDPANKVPPPPDLASLCQMEADLDQSRSETHRSFGARDAEFREEYRTEREASHLRFTRIRPPTQKPQLKAPNQGHCDVTLCKSASRYRQ